MGILKKTIVRLKNFLPSKDHWTGAAVGVAVVVASLAAVGAIAAFIGIGGSVAIPVLLTLAASATALEIAFKYAYDDKFKLGTCLAAAAATAGGLTLVFNSIFHKAPEQPPSAPRFQTTVLKQTFDKSATGRNVDAASTYRITRPGTPAIASPSGG
jgi:hypothetical protein